MRGEEALRLSDTGLSARKIEQILRAGGVSKSIARANVAHGWQDASDQDDADPEAVAALAQHIKAAAERLKGLTNA